MSGGFFRGTSAEQDTRFSNKQAKLMKSQKFAPELEHLVDMTKVKMDVIKPWIATRVTELLGFEDEVLINFIYGLLDAKDVNGKEIQIQLTGFMEKNTVKFMKELWTLLLSAQMNASGVPQQFLDAKEEETRKKKEDADRIMNEIQKKREKESRELDQERSRKMDGNGKMKSGDAELVPSSRRPSKFSHPDDEGDAEQRNAVQRKKRDSRSPPSAARSKSPPRRSRSRSLSKSPNSRSDADNNRRSRSPSRSPETRRRSLSLDRVKRSSRSPRRSRSPVQRRFRSPYRRKSISKSPRRSRSPLRRRFRSPYRRSSPYRRRSPFQRRSPYPVRRSPSPGRRASPRRRRSPSPVRRRSPPRRRLSPSPHRRRRSPVPVRRRSPPPMRRRSPSPKRQRRQRSPSTPRRNSPSPVKRRPLASSGRRSLTPPKGRRSLSPYQSSSPSSERRRSPSPVRRKSVREHRRSPSESPRGRDSLKERSSPMARRPSSIKSVHRDTRDEEELRNKGSVLSSSPAKSPTRSKSPPKTSKTAGSEDGSPFGSPRQRRERMAHGGNLSPKRKSREFVRQDSPESSREDVVNKARDDADKPRSSRGRTMHSPDASKRNNSLSKLHSPERLAGSRSTEPQNPSDGIEPREKYTENKIEKSSRKEVHPGTPDQRSSPIPDQSRKSETVAMSVDNDLSNMNINSDIEEKDKPRSKHKEKRKHKRSGRQEGTSDDDYSSDSDIEDRKEAKRRKKEEKRLKKEEKRRRREEKHRKREERRLEKRKSKNQDDSNASDGEHISKKGHRSSDDEETISNQKKLEIELREKALESLKAKKGIGC